MSELWKSLTDAEALSGAWREVRRRKSMAGVDGVSVAEFGRRAPTLLDELRRDLRTENYRPQPLKGIFIPKAAGGWRRVGVPTVRDRIAQRAALNALLPLLEPHLEECSYAYRPGRSIGDALGQIERWRDQGHRYLLESDIKECFDSIEREQLLATLGRYVADERVLELVRCWLQVGTLWPSNAPAHNPSGREPGIPHLDNLHPCLANRRSGNGGTDVPTAPLVPMQLVPASLESACGIPQGGVLSPLLCNLYLDAFDEKLMRQRFKMVRYADDFVIVAARRERAEAALEAAEIALSDLGLRLHPSKTRLATFDTGFRYLGTIFMGEMALPALRHETQRPDGTVSLRFSSGYGSGDGDGDGYGYGPGSGHGAMQQNPARVPREKPETATALRKNIQPRTYLV